MRAKTCSGRGIPFNLQDIDVNKALLIKRLSQTFMHLPEAQLHHMTNTIISLLGETLARGERIEIRGFGSFVTKSYPPRKVHNPRTGSYHMAAASIKPTFKVSTLLKARLNATTVEKTKV